MDFSRKYIKQSMLALRSRVSRVSFAAGVISRWKASSTRTFALKAAVLLRRAAVTTLWYLPAAIVLSIGVAAAFVSVDAALRVFLFGTIVAAFGLWILARNLRKKVDALFARMPKVRGSVPRRFEVHAMIMGVPDRPLPHSREAAEQELAQALLNPSEMMEDNFESPEEGAFEDVGADTVDTDGQAAAEKGAPDSGPTEKQAAKKNTSKADNDDDLPDESEDDLLDAGDEQFEMFELPELRRERPRKSYIH